MYKITLLLIPLILLSSCTIDGNIRKETSQQIQKNPIHTRVISVEDIKWEVSTWATTQDFWSGFILSQTEKKTELTYSGKVAKTWLHTPPKDVPFVWDEACSLVWLRFEKLTPGNQSTGKQLIWDALTEKEKQECMKESFAKNISIEFTPNPRFYSISQSWYDWYNQWIYDTLSWNIQDLNDSFYMIRSINVKNNYILIVVEEWQSIWLQYVFVYDKNFTKKITQWPTNSTQPVEITTIHTNSNILEISAHTIWESIQKEIKHTIQLP